MTHIDDAPLYILTHVIIFLRNSWPLGLLLWLAVLFLSTALLFFVLALSGIARCGESISEGGVHVCFEKVGGALR